MASDDGRAGGDGVRVFRDTGLRRVVQGLTFAAGLATLATIAVIVAIRLAPAGGPSPVAPVAADREAPPPAPPAAASTPPAPAQGVAPAAAPSTASTGTRPTPRRIRRAQELAALLEAARSSPDPADHEGIAAFPPPGTDPPKPGLIVPEDFVLPPGYVRHYQATDDGERLSAILMFHPDFEWVDAEGRPITLPADGVVPPELAPAGMPLQTLEIPERPVPLFEDAPRRARRDRQP